MVQFSKSQIDSIKDFRLEYDTEKKTPKDESDSSNRELTQKEKVYLEKLGAKFESDLYKAAMRNLLSKK